MAKKKEENNSKRSTTPPADADSKKKKPSRADNGRFVKGHAKEGGRVACTKNRNSNIRDTLKQQLEPLLANLALDLMKVETEEGTAARMALQEKYMPYFMPKFSTMSFSADQDRPISEEQRLKELDALYTKKELSINFKSMTIVDNDKLKADDPEADEDDFDLSIFSTSDE